MDIQVLIVFAVALFVVAITPGPAITALVSRTLGFGLNGTFAFVCGMLVGSMALFNLAMFGLAQLASTYLFAFTIAKYLGAAYLTYLAYKLWKSNSIQTYEKTEERSFSGQSFVKTALSGMLITLSNPKGLLFYAALMPTLVPMETITTVGQVELMSVAITVLLAVFAIYIAITLRARNLLTSQKAVGRLNKGASLAMAGAALTIVAR